MKTLSEENKKSQYQGDVILKNQKTADQDGFSHVSKLWLGKTLTFEQMLAKGREFQAKCEDIEGLSLRDISSVLSEIRLTTLGEAVPTEHAHKQLCSFLGLPADYLSFLKENGDLDLFDINFNRAVDRANLVRQGYDQACANARKTNSPKPLRPERIDRQVFLRTRAENGYRVLRAVLSSKYAVINNLPVIETIAEVVPGGRLSHLHYDGDTLRANVLVPDCIRAEKDSDYGGGISVLNNETGRAQFRSRPFVFRAICMNGNIWDRADGVEFSRRHLGTIDWTQFRKAIVMNIQKQIPLVQANIDRVLALKSIPVTQKEIEKAIVYIGQKERMTKAQMREWAVGFEQELRGSSTASEILTAFGVVQGLTRGAQTQEFDAREMMETLSARLIESNWDKTLTAARVVTDEEVAEAIGA